MPECVSPQPVYVTPGSRSLDRRRFVMALGISIVLHATVLVWRGEHLRGVGSESLRAGQSLRVTLQSNPSNTTVLETTQPTEQILSESTAGQVETTFAPSAWSAPISTSASPSEDTKRTDSAEAASPRAGGGTPMGNETFAIPSLSPHVPAIEFTLRASVAQPIHYSYPADIPFQGGRVRVRLLLSEKGVLEDIKVMDSAPPGVFDREAIAILRAHSYAPARMGPYPMRSYLYMELTFSPGPGGQKAYYAGNTRAPSQGNHRPER